MKFKKELLVFPLYFIMMVVNVLGCNPADPSIMVPTTTKIQLTPFLTSSFSKITEKDGNNSTITPLSTPMPSQTPTPFTYTVVEGDTFTSIAFQHGVKLADLLTANPDIDPDFLSVGITITIPISGSNPITALNPTPIPLATTTPVCYQNQIGGIWCLTQIFNAEPYDVENISVKFFISSDNQEEELSQVIYSPLHVLPSELWIPLMVYFEPPIPADAQAYVEILSVIPKSSEEGRYLTPIIEKQSITISDNNLKAVVEGELSILEKVDAGQIWILGVAYSQDGSPVGFRKWEASSSLSEGERLFFNFRIYSLGPIIENVKLYVETRP